MTIKVCMGSSCYLKGSYDVVKKLQELKKNGENFELLGSLCFGKCMEGICVEIDGEIITGITRNNIQPILDRIKEKKHG
jgi:NADH:ubiquinone oxidoreductase subunit E